jgi:hypothetical protein
MNLLFYVNWASTCLWSQKSARTWCNEHKEHTVSLLVIAVSIYKKILSFSVLRPLRDIGKFGRNMFLALPLAIPQN